MPYELFPSLEAERSGWALLVGCNPSLFSVLTKYTRNKWLTKMNDLAVLYTTCVQQLQCYRLQVDKR